MLDQLRAALSGHYVVEREIGRGATATVFAARDLKHGRRVALKVLAPQLATTVGPERFLHEVRTTAALSHPNILPLFDSGHAGDFIYFTMPLVVGETLRERLEREGPLPVDTVAAIAGQVAQALAHAHAAGIVHRDIKPENILLDESGHVWVADFGLARALARATDYRVTGAGFVVGSPYYLSPEQAAGRSDIDGRSDVYALGCVVFELLAGRPPFSEGDVPALLTRHMTEAPPELGGIRRDVPPSVVGAVHRALAKDRAQRFDDAASFAAALGSVDGPRRHARRRADRLRIRPAQLRVPLLAGGAVVAALLVWLAGTRLSGLGARGDAAPDSSLFAILPFQDDGGMGGHEDQMLRNAFLRWRDLRVVDGFQVSDAIARRGGGAGDLSDAREIARAVNAGRMVRGRISRAGDSVIVHAQLFDVTSTRRPLAESTLRIPLGEARVEAHYTALANRLLFGERVRGAALARAGGTDSHRAHLAFLAAERATWEWQLEQADSLLDRALQEDPSYPDALLLRAQVRYWLNGLGGPALRAAEAAAAASDQLGEYQQRMAQGLLALTSRQFSAACTTYDGMLRDNPRDFVAVRGLADCHQFDSLVVRDPRSPTGWSFRSSGQQALLYHIRAFHLVPASHRAFRAGRFMELREDMFYTALSALRSGRNEQGESFGARPAWTSDTLAFYPMPLSAVVLGEGIDVTAVTAVTRLRRILFDVTAGWVAAYPRSVDALESHAIAMELQGDPRAVEIVEQARRLTDDPERNLNLAISSFWLRLKRSVPAAPEGIRAARALADSIVGYDGPMSEGSAARLAAVAAATGRVHRAAELARRGARNSSRPLRVAEAGAVLLTYAAVGGPADSIAVWEQRVEDSIRHLLPPEEASTARAELLGRAAPLALPVSRMDFIGSVRLDDYLLTAIESLLDGRFAAVRAVLARVAADRTHVRAADIKLEGLVAEAWLLMQIGDVQAAAARLRPTLDDIAWIEPGGLESVAAAGSMARSFLLRAEMEHALGDRAAARRWSTAFSELWRNADVDLRARLADARRVAG